MCVGWWISLLYPAVDVKDSILCPSGESGESSAYHLEDLALKSPIDIEQSGFKSLILERHNKSRSPQKSSNWSWFWLGDL